jgi:CRP-like cAMP-binding protein
MNYALVEALVTMGLSDQEAQSLEAVVVEKTLPPRFVLCNPGEGSNHFYYLIQGAVEVVLGKLNQDETVVAKVSGGQFAGELELMTHSGRVAALRCSEETHLVEFSIEKFDALLNRNDRAANKIVYLIAKTLARRLASTNQHLITKLLDHKAKEAEAIKREEDAIPELTDAVTEVDESDEEMNLLDKLWS